MAHFGGRYFGSSYFGPRYWGTQQVELPPGSIHGQAAGIAAATASLTALGALSASSAGIASVIGTLTANDPNSMSGSASGSATVTGTLSSTGTPAEVPSQGTGNGGRSAGDAYRKKKKKKRTVEEELELARIRGTLRKLADIWSNPPETHGLPTWEEMADQYAPKPEPVLKAKPKAGPAFMIPETDSFEKITEASRRVIDALLAQAQARAEQTSAAERQQIANDLKRKAEEDDEDILELMLLDLL